MPTYDHIVIGLGSMGAAACYYLAERGRSVLGIEQFRIPHENGSHGGQSRIIRKAYFEHPDYIPLLLRAYENWRHIEARSGRRVYLQTGLFYAGPQGHETLDNVKRSAALYGLPLEQWSVEEARRRFPQFRLPDDHETLFEPEAGLLMPETAIRTYAEEARKLGAAIHEEEAVLGWEATDGGVKVTTHQGEYTCKKLVVTAGAWSGRLIPGIAGKLKVTRQVLAWFKARRERDYAPDNFPCWLMAQAGKPGSYYGFPVLQDAYGGPAGLKVAWHHPDMPCDPDAVDRSVTAGDTDHLKDFMDACFGGDHGVPIAVKTCLYSNSPDEHFVIDNLPGMEDRVCMAWGFSGHGFKFVSAVGEILADLAMYGSTAQPIGFLRAGRFG